MEFIPMIPKTTDVTPETLQQVIDEPSEWLLTFNEPKLISENLTYVAEALTLWPQLEATGKKLGSPLVSGEHVNSPSFVEFMAQVQERGLQVDFLNVDYYGGIDIEGNWNVEAAVGKMKDFLNSTYATYQKSIWITAFGLIDFSSEPIACPQAAEQAEFVKAATDMMNSLDYVDRYGYFPLWPISDGCEAYLYNKDGAITIVGESYKDVL